MTQDTIKSLLPKFMASLAEKGRSPATILAYRSDLEQLVEFLTKGSIATPDQVKLSNLDSFRDTLLSEKYTPKSVSRKLNAVKTFFRWMVEQNYLSTDLSKSVSHPKVEASMPKFLTPLEYRALRDAVRNDPRISAMIELILQTGLRISEVANIKTADINEETIKIEGYATQPERTIPLNKPAKEAIEKYMIERPKVVSEYIFISKTGKPLAVRNIRASVDRFIQKAELPKYSVNDLRTTFIVENIKNGVDLILISQVAGHKRLSTTERYIELAGTTESSKKQSLIEL
ncbi:MAG: tyrosine recombinase integrase/recombinase XerC [Candidatus Woesebacteria bacterium GW2011_GWF1_31_35]|uniref:Tyrosine recombinase XerC n=1 Tax=Candidatus Woesebacteria bacterium GW2011_GWC2_31_9 TaxID=1618586 RepID=A0A0G0AYV6_9BACT|nr:MAG: tyrosine recombinase integrase/recombinase XerC [Candidatus Woesebacteria bacterium GW2011_GWF1_31_35]KKP23129.1 MAG: Tyrosine recombinase XerC [Candidatus Woesebacteria bacterium GW2011_GWC1_30_29]KKP26817.1 MAG: Tyrosine recombinase XerC [Candidatus Woesebacteria bacterium GW2011_GWD1_31_12]KKP27392.1 MAG: Tyrosine recombinase XerC [Candidatus Woesebacteria bacterium GW2011_GWB1_31_29]KKP31725.1 MAG: Tyrosine recombinase XerC [Candidatus Woesebacteria bacterium GW2011_GWC2_31_9]KKP33